MGDALLDAIRASPDDDAPRLVWADREGGERGELVVVQCALAKGEDPKLRAREKELLKRVPSPLGALGGEFRRGFVEHLRIEFSAFATRSAQIFGDCPTLRSLDLRTIGREVSYFTGPTPAEEWADAMKRFATAFAKVQAGQLLALEADTTVQSSGDWNDLGQTDYFGDAFVATVAAIPALAELPALVMPESGLSRAAIPHFANLKLRSLRCGRHKLDVDDLARLVRALPTLRVLAPWTGEPPLRGEALRRFLATPEFEQLTALELLPHELDPGDAQLVAASTLAASAS